MRKQMRICKDYIKISKESLNDSRIHDYPYRQSEKSQNLYLGLHMTIQKESVKACKDTERNSKLRKHMRIEID